jgi:septum formation protein
VRLLLASASPRRAELLRAAGLDFDTVAVDIDEAFRLGEAPEDYVSRLAAEKSARGVEAVARQEPVVVLGADTAVVIDGAVLGKPRDDEQARQMLRRLSGRHHEVMTGINMRAGRLELAHVEVTLVEFVPLSEADIAWYVASGEGRDKAGAYAIQGLASRYIPRIDGSYSNVVGLPIAPVFALLTEIGWDGAESCVRSGDRLS